MKNKKKKIDQGNNNLNIIKWIRTRWCGRCQKWIRKILYTNNIDFAFPETTQYLFKVFFLSWGAPPKAKSATALTI